MKKSIAILLLFTCWTFCGFGKNNPLLFTEKTSTFLQLLETGKQKFCVTENSIYAITKKGLETKASLPYKCMDAVVYKHNIALATADGIRVFDTETGKLSSDRKSVV